MEFGLRSAGEAFLREWMGSANYMKWLKLARQVQLASQQEFMDWLLTAAEESITSQQQQEPETPPLFTMPRPRRASNCRKHANSNMYSVGSQQNSHSQIPFSEFEKHEVAEKSARIDDQQPQQPNPDLPLGMNHKVNDLNKLCLVTSPSSIQRSCDERGDLADGKNYDHPEVGLQAFTVENLREIDRIPIKTEIMEDSQDNDHVEIVGDLAALENTTSASSAKIAPGSEKDLSQYYLEDYSGDLDASQIEACRSTVYGGMRQHPYECPTCKKFIPDRINLIRHYRSHSKFQPYTCRFCGLKASLKFSIKRHVQNLHSQHVAMAVVASSVPRAIAGSIT